MDLVLCSPMCCGVLLYITWCFFDVLDLGSRGLVGGIGLFVSFLELYMYIGCM